MYHDFSKSVFTVPFIISRATSWADNKDQDEEKESRIFS